MITYELIFSVNLGNAVDEIGAVIDSVNSHLATMGITERLAIRGKVLKMSLECNRELKSQEWDMVKGVLLRKFNEALPGLDVRIDNVRRKSCDKSRSRSQ